MNYDARIEDKIDTIVYHIQTNEGIELSHKSRHDLYSNTRDIAKYWKEDSDEIREENPWLQLNELKIWLKEKKPEGYDVVLNLMERLKNKEYIRNTSLECIKNNLVK